MDSLNVEELLETAKSYLATTGPIEWSVAGGVLLLLIIALSSGGGRRKRKKRAKSIAPKLVLQGFQLSPLGRDASLKITNMGGTAKITKLKLKVKNKQNINIKNEAIGHEMPTGASYRILLESGDGRKLDTNFIIEVNYLDQVGNIYLQDINIKQGIAKPPKLIRLV